MGTLWRRGVIRVAPVAGLLVAALLATSNAQAMTESFQVFVFTPTPGHIYKVGDPATLTIRVFNLGVASDPDNVTVQLNPFSANARWVIPIRTGVGAYGATFQILSSDLGSFSYYGGTSYVVVSVVARLGLLSSEQLTSIQVGDLLEASVSTSTSSASPGDRVDLSVIVRRDGVLIDADTVGLNASRYTDLLPPTSEALPVSRASTGTYVASYTIPASLNQSTTIVFSAGVYLGGNYTFGSAFVSVPLPPTLDVWTHQVPVENAFAVVVEVYAANSTGWPVPGANVTMRSVALRLPFGQTVTDLNGTTDRLGRASFNVTYLPGSLLITYAGNVTTGTARQSYAGFIFPIPPQPSGALEARRNDTIPFDEVGSMARLNYTMLYQGATRANQVVYFYASTSSEILANGTITTDAFGRFTVSFVMPPSLVRLDFAVDIDGLWFSTTNIVAPVRPLAVEHGDFRIGGVTHVTVPVPSALGPWVGIALFLPYDFSAPLPYSAPTWQPSASYGGLFGSLIAPSGTTFSFDMRAPRFLPKDADYLFAVEVLSLTVSPGLATSVPYVHFEKIHIANAAPTVAAELSSASLLQGETLSVNVSRSSDADGIIDAYRIDWGDGASTGWTVNASAQHVFSASGDFSVVIEVRDDTGAVSSTQQTVHIEGLILGMRAWTFALTAGAVVVVVAVAMALVVRRARRARLWAAVLAPLSTGPPEPSSPWGQEVPPPPSDSAKPPERPPPPP